MAVQPDVEKKGFLQAVADTASDVFTRITAGIPPGEVRAMLRGQPPGRPNPRLKPHSEAFLLHIKPTYYHESVTRFTYTFRLGLLSTYLFLLETITGIILMIWYSPTPAQAYSDMIRLLSNVPFGQFMRDLHRLGAELMVLVVTAHMVRTYLTGSYKAPRQFTWFTGVILLVLTLFLSFSGYLLPWDQLAFWAVTIGTSMAEAAPPEIVGTNVNLLLRGAPDIGAGGLLRFYLLHVFLLPALTAVFLGVHYYKVILHGHSLPPKLEEIGQDSAKRVPMDRRVYYTPDVLSTEVLWTGAVTLILTVMCIWFFHAPLETHANPQVTPLHTTAPWYFLWLQGMLKLGDKILFGLVIPTVLLGMFMVWPWLDTTISRRYVHRRVQLSIMCLFCFAMFLLTYMGTGKWGVETSPDQEVVQAIAPMEGVGAVRSIPFDEMVNGTYCTSNLDETHALEMIQWGLTPPPGPLLLPDTAKEVTCQAVPAESPALHKVMERYEHEIEKWRAGKTGEMIGMLTISDQATDVKRLDLKVIWQIPDTQGRTVLTNADGSVKVKMVEWKFDEKGNPIETARMAPALLSSGKTIFVSRLSEYQGGGH
jgi:quinol-cytochrome oxidoreductase complex cytochrome b subunit